MKTNVLTGWGAVCLLLCATAAPATEFFFGLPFTPLGEARLMQDPDSGYLMLENLSPSGEDGFVVDLGSTGGVVLYAGNGNTDNWGQVKKLTV